MPQNVYVLGIDRSENMLARARAQTHAPGVTYVLADIEHLALPEAAFDLVYSALTLHYIADFGAVCVTIRRLLGRIGWRWLLCLHEHDQRLRRGADASCWRTGGVGDRGRHARSQKHLRRDQDRGGEPVRAVPPGACTPVPRPENLALLS
jgi:SAM-dependent methyltransferase